MTEEEDIDNVLLDAFFYFPEDNLLSEMMNESE